MSVRTSTTALAATITALALSFSTFAPKEAAAVSVDAVAKASDCSNPNRGSGGEDTLIGTGTADLIASFGGADEIRGKASSDCLKAGSGDDAVDGGAGSDAIDAGSGSDVIDARDGRHDVIQCGSGSDVAYVDHDDDARRCEKVLSKRAPAEPASASEPAGASTAEPGSCLLPELGGDLTRIGFPGCTPLVEDTGATPSPLNFWGDVECGTSVDAQDASRHEFIPTGGDPSPTAADVPQADTGFRRLTVRDGDDFYGERCELGDNNHLIGPTAVYREGQRRLTAISYRLPDSFDLATRNWQTVMQIKQSQPSAGGGGGPMLELNARNNRWYLFNQWNELWSVPAEKNVWTRFMFDVRFSQDPNLGFVRAYVDLDGDGDIDEQSPTFQVQTLKTEIEGGWAGDQIVPGASIPSHLRAGIYHDPAIDCPDGGCQLDIDNVQVLKP